MVLMADHFHNFPLVFDVLEFARCAKIISFDSNFVTVMGIKRTPVIFPRYIGLTKDLAWALGFFMAEGSSTYAGISVANCEILLIQKFKTDLEESFGIKREKWRAYVKTSEIDIDLVRKKWINALGLQHVRVAHANLARTDCIELRLNSTVISNIFNEFEKRALPAVFERRETIISFLDGYEVGDGSVIQRNGCLHGIEITVKDAEMKDFLVECFRRLYNKLPCVRRTKECYGVRVAGVHTMTQLILDGHFISSQRQWKKFLSCYSKKEYSRAHIRYWLALSNGWSSIADIARVTGRSHWSVRDALNLDTKLGLAEVENRHVLGNKAPYFKFFRLSERGGKLIKILKLNDFHENKCVDSWSSGT